MPYEVRKLPYSKLYRVRNKETKEIKANATTRENAFRQVKLLNSFEKDKKKWIL